MTLDNVCRALPLLRKRIHARWGIRRLHRWLVRTHPVASSTLLFDLILAIAEEQGKPFPRRNIRRASQALHIGVKKPPQRTPTRAKEARGAVPMPPTPQSDENAHTGHNGR